MDPIFFHLWSQQTMEELKYECVGERALVWVRDSKAAEARLRPHSVSWHILEAELWNLGLESEFSSDFCADLSQPGWPRHLETTLDQPPGLHSIPSIPPQGDSYPRLWKLWSWLLSTGHLGCQLSIFKPSKPNKLCSLYSKVKIKGCSYRKAPISPTLQKNGGMALP